LYYVRAFATNGVNTSYGAVVSFTTDVLITAPVVVSDSVTGVTISAATVNGTVNSDGGTAITERGFVYSASNGSPTVADQKVAIAGTTGAMQYALINLSSDTVYFIRAFATNNQGTTYGTVLTFRTVKEATIIRNLGTTPVDTGAVTEEPTVGETIVTSPLEGNNITDDMTPTTSPTETPILTKSEESKSENLVTTTITLFGSAIFILLGVLFFRSKKKNTEGIGQ
jgi:hypothetical protein